MYYNVIAVSRYSNLTHKEGAAYPAATGEQ